MFTSLHAPSRASVSVISPERGRRGALDAPEPGARDVAEQVDGALAGRLVDLEFEPGAAFLPGLRFAGRCGAVVALGAVRKQIVCGRDLLEAFRGRFFASVHVGVQFFREFPVSALDFVERRLATDAENFVGRHSGSFIVLPDRVNLRRRTASVSSLASSRDKERGAKEVGRIESAQPFRFGGVEANNDAGAFGAENLAKRATGCCDSLKRLYEYRRGSSRAAAVLPRPR